jgi:hypothetical protein
MVLRSLGAICCMAGAVLSLCGGAAAAADCPNAKKPTQAFRVSVGNASATDVYRLDTGETRTVTRFKGGAITEQTYYQGLIPIEHIDDGRRATYAPKSALSALFPLKVGQTYRVDFDMQAPDGKKSILQAVFKVTGKDKVAIGACSYEVFKVEHSASRGKAPLQFINTDWYAPDIRLIVAREYRDGKRGSIINKYDTISVIDGATGK